MHLGKDSSCPPPTPGKKRLYSMRFCPYAERAIIALNMKCIEFERVNIKLRSEKPAWYFEINPKGSVPCLVLEDGQKIAESEEIVEFADSNSSCCGHKFALETGEEKERHAVAMAEHPKMHKVWYALMFDQDIDEEQLITAMRDVMAFYDSKIVGPYFHGDCIRSTDLLLFPWFERLESCFKMAGKPFPAVDYPKLVALIEKLASIETVRSEMKNTDSHYRFSVSCKTGKRNYEIQ